MHQSVFCEITVPGGGRGLERSVGQTPCQGDWVGFIIPISQKR